MGTRLATVWLGLVAGLSAQAQRIDDWPVDPFTAIEALAVLPPAADGITVSVRGVDGAPVAGADVVVVPPRADDYMQEQRFLSTRCASQPRDFAVRLAGRFGVRYRSGDDGRAKVAAGRYYLAITRDQLGFGWGNGDVKVAMEPCAAVAVEVVDSDGRPAAGVDVAVAAAGSTSPLAFGRTGRDGRARARCAPGKELEVRALIAGADVRARLPEDYFGKPALQQLQLPPCGSVEVRVLDDAGQPATDVQWVGFADTWNAMTELRSDGGRFDQIAVGAELKARVGLQGVEGFVAAFGSGPERAGGVARLDIRLADCAPIVHLRLVDADGRPLARAALWRELQVRRGVRMGTIQLDEDGRFASVIADLDTSGGTLLLRDLRKVDGATRYGGAAVVQLRRGQTGTLEFGDLQLQPEPVYLAGRVVDEDGDGVVGAMVTAVNDTVRTDGDGRFEFRHSAPPPLPVMVSVRGGDQAKYWAESLRANPGRTDLVLRVQHAGFLELTLAEPGPAVDCLRFALVGRGEREAPLLPVRQGRLRVDSLRPGTYDLHCVLPNPNRWGLRDNQGTDLFVIEGLVVPSGAACPDPRLQGLPWRSKVPTRRVQLRDERGQPLRGKVTVELLGHGGEVACDDAGNAEVPVPKPMPLPPIVLAKAPEYRSQPLPAGDGDCTVQLRRCARLRFHLPERMALPPEVGLRMAGVWCANWQHGEILRPDASGPVEVALLLWGPNGQVTLWADEIAVPDDEALRDIELKIDASVTSKADDVDAAMKGKQRRNR